MKQLRIKIDGMTCDECARRAEKALNALPGVDAAVSFDTGLANISTQGKVKTHDLLQVITAKGYTGLLVSDQPANDPGEGALHIAIIGTGSGAFAAAIKAADAGARVTLIEGADVIGGTCVNIGCVPSKIMIRGAHVAHQQAHHAFAGVPHNAATIDRKAMIAQQQHWVEQLRQAKYEDILETNPNINLIRGWARFSDANTLTIKLHNGNEKQLQADRFLLAVGASASIPAIAGLAETPYWTSTEALIAEALPQHLVVLGGSVVALELAQAFLHLGVKVTVMARSTLLSKDDPAIGEGLAQILRDEGMQVMLHTVPTTIHHDGTRFRLQLDGQTITADRVLVATGRAPNTANLGLAELGVDLDKNGAVLIDDHMQSSVAHIYAAGDCTTQPQYVYVAAAAGTRAATNMMGGDAHIDLSVMPAVVFTSPQVATVGLSEADAIAQGLTVDSRTLSLDNVPRALANMDTRGFIKLVAEKDSGLILGCQVLAEEGGEIIQSAALAIRNRMTIEGLAGQLFPYLTLVEGLKLCAQTFNKDVKQLSCCAG